ncbi:MAG TPA: AraC family transcriptional regulator [Anaeromyxobacteraceae bacterium]|nr:AraC family transcriptional regulator [Anaeromyxobacteraceae bacterium]
MPSRFPQSLFATQIDAARYYCPEISRSRQALEVVCAGWESCRKDYELVRNAFPFMAVELVAKGEGSLEIDGNRYPLRAGALFCYGHHTALHITSDAERPLVKYFVSFTGPRARSALAESPLRVGQVLQSLYPNEIEDILERVIVEGNKKSALSPAIVSNYLRIFFHKLHECTEGHRGVESHRALASYLRAKALLEENFTRLTRAKDAARELGMTAETLCRLFHHFSGTTPYRFLLKLRLNLAVDLLLGTDLLVKEVAARAGFEDPFHFSRVFRRVQGIPPADFQRLHKRVSAGEGPAIGPTSPSRRWPDGPALASLPRAS